MLCNEAVEQHRLLHKNPKKFLGFSIKRHVDSIHDLIIKHNTNTLLDFGCGKGMQYLSRRVHDLWGGTLPVCYDPCVTGLDVLPRGTFGGVICTDVLEHITIDGLDEELHTIFNYANKFVFLSISISPSRKKLPNGENCHVNIQPKEWWEKKLNVFTNRYGVECVRIYMDYSNEQN